MRCDSNRIVSRSNPARVRRRCRHEPRPDPGVSNPRFSIIPPDDVLARDRSECERYSVQRCPIALQRVQELGGAAGRRSNGECSLAVKRMTIPPARVALSGRTAGRRKRNAADAILVVLRGSVRPLPPAVRPAEFDERRLAQPVRMNNVLGNHSYPHRPQASMGRVI